MSKYKTFSDYLKTLPDLELSEEYDRISDALDDARHPWMCECIPTETEIVHLNSCESDFYDILKEKQRRKQNDRRNV